MTRRILIVLVILGLAAAAVVLSMRIRLEARNRAVEIVLDADDWIGLSRREGRDPAAMLRALRQRGASSVALSDNTLRRLAEEGKVSYASGGNLASLGLVSALQEPFRRLQVAGTLRSDTVYITGSVEHLTFVASRLRALLGPSRVRTLNGVVEVLGAQTDLEEIGLGFRPSDAEPFRAAELGVVLRPRNYRGLSTGGLNTLVDGYAETAPAPTLIFALTEVQGYEGLIEDAATAYQRVGARVGRIEVFTARRKQRGEDRMTALMRPSVIRVFSVTPEELLVLRPGDVADRFMRAAQERNIRLLYVRPLLGTPAGESAMDANLGLVEMIAGNLRRFGFSPERARPLPPLAVPGPLLWLVALGSAALSALVLDDLARAMGVPLPHVLLWGIVVGVVAGSVAAGLTRFGDLWSQLLALATAIAGAAGAVVWALPKTTRTGAALVAIGWITLVRAIGLAVIAGVFVAALLSRWPFMLAFSTFLGVKAGHVVPVVLVGLWLAFADRAHRDWRTTLRDLRAWINQPLRLGMALAVLVGGLAAVMLLARTGNVSLPLLGAELQLRARLEDLLVARPRTKEFLIGYPALVLAGTAAGLGWRRVAEAFALAGTVGTAGAINSFSHLHTPFLYTVWRTGNAAIVGATLAIPGVLVLLWLARRLPRS